MPYKDEDRQREANREAMRRSRAKGITNAPPLGITEQGITKPKRGKDIKDRLESDQRFTRLLATVPPGTPNQRVSKPGDEDYKPMCETMCRQENRK